MGVWTMAGVRAMTAVACVMLTGAAARADDFLDKANALYAPIAEDRRSDLVILPLLSKMEAPPKVPGDYLSAALMTTQNAAWEAAAAWAKAKPQQDVLDGLKKVTSEEDARKAWAFGQPYGGAAVKPEFVDMGLYTELGEDGTLAAADFKFLPAILKMELLCHIESTRLLAEGKGNDSLNLMCNWLTFSHQIASRQMLTEKITGMRMMSLAFARMRDLAYTDMISEKQTMTPEGLRTVIARLDVRNPVNSERLGLPEAERLAAEQLVSRTFTPDGGPNPASFARVYARVAAKDRSLRRFSESAKWDSILKLHGTTTETKKMIRDVYGDWERRWDISQWDLIQEIPTDYARLDKVKFAALDLVMGDVGAVFPARRQGRAEWVGTRTALGIYGYRLQQGVLPVRAESVVPVFIRKNDLMNDSFDKTAKEAASKRLVYFRATVDNIPPGGRPQPHTMRLFPKVEGVEFPNFEAKVGEGQFVLYSAGPDGNQSGMLRATQMVKDDKGDYLLWPPMLSLMRQNLSETGAQP